MSGQQWRDCSIPSFEFTGVNVQEIRSAYNDVGFVQVKNLIDRSLISNFVEDLAKFITLSAGENYALV